MAPNNCVFFRSLARSYRYGYGYRIVHYEYGVPTTEYEYNIGSDNAAYADAHRHPYGVAVAMMVYSITSSQHLDKNMTWHQLML